MNTNTQRWIGLLLIGGAVGVLVPYTILTMIFEYPDILREEAGVVLAKFNAGGAGLIWTWWAFAMMGLPLVWAYMLIGQQLERRVAFARVATTIGVVSGLVQVIGLLRWAFVVPTLARAYVESSSDASREATVAVFWAVHQFGGVLLGEHLGQLLTIVWTVMIALALDRLGMIPKWLARFGYVASGVYLLAQAELFATVIPGFPVVPEAGLIGSTMWLAWLIAVGIRFVGLRADGQSVSTEHILNIENAS